MTIRTATAVRMGKKCSLWRVLGVVITAVVVVGVLSSWPLLPPTTTIHGFVGIATTTRFRSTTLHTRRDSILVVIPQWTKTPTLAFRTTPLWSSNREDHDDDDDDDDDDIPSLEQLWNDKKALERHQKERQRNRKPNDNDADDQQQEELMDQQQHQEQQQQHTIPSTGISLSDELDAAWTNQHQAFVTNVIPITQRRRRTTTTTTRTTTSAADASSSSSQRVVVAAQLDTQPVDPEVVAFEPRRYLIPLEENSNNDNKHKQKPVSFAMVDVPPYSPALVAKMQEFMIQYNTPKNNQSSQNKHTTTTTATTTTSEDEETSFSSSSSLTTSVSRSWLVAILITSSDAIFVPESPTQLYSTTRRGALLAQWQRAFPQAVIVMNRLETPRDCQPSLSSLSSSPTKTQRTTNQNQLQLQRLDGQGPFGWNATTRHFDEMGQALRLQPWDYNTTQRFLKGSLQPEELEQMMENQSSLSSSSSSLSLPQLIRSREEGRSILAVMTPGHSFGSMTFLFPNVGICCSGYTLPVEDDDYEYDDDDGSDEDSYHHPRSAGRGGGPALDVRGYIATSRAGMSRQMQSARSLVTTYGDRFSVVLASRGNPLLLPHDDDDYYPNDEKDDDNENNHDSTTTTSFATQERQAILNAMIDQYDQIGQIYEQLGITSSS